MGHHQVRALLGVSPPIAEGRAPYVDTYGILQYGHNNRATETGVRT